MDPKLASIDSMTGDDPTEWWQLPYVAQFCYVFRPAFSFPDFIVEDLEDALRKPGENGSVEWKLICDVHVRMLRGILPNRGVNAENWQDHLRKLMRGKAKRSRAASISEDITNITNTNSNSPSCNENGSEEQMDDGESPEAEGDGTDKQKPNVGDEQQQWNPLGESTDYRDLSIRDKVAILFLLSEMRLDAADCHDALKGWDGDYLRLQPIGFDRHENRYWFMDSGMRLYKEVAPKLEVPSAEEEKPVKKKKEKKVKAKRGRGRPKKSSPAASPVDKSYARSKRSSFRSAVSKINHEPESESEDDVEEDEEEKKEPPFPPLISLSTSLIGEWSVVADCQEDWDTLTEKFARSRNADERELGKFIQSELLENVTKKRALREKQQRKKQILENMPRRASDRITIMKLTREEEEKQAEQRREMFESEKRQAEEERQRRMVESRREMREKRMLARAEKATEQGQSVSDDQQRQAPPYGMTEEKYDSLYAILEALRRTNHAWLFEEPVSDEIAPNYSLVVKRPMDLSSAECKLDEYSYKHPSEFIEDLRVMCANCRLYNGPKSQYFKMADLMEACLKRHSAKHFPRLEWGDPPVLPPSDPLPLLPKPQKRKSFASGEDSDEAPQAKLKTPFKHPKTEAASSESFHTHLGRQHPVAGVSGNFMSADGHQPVFANNHFAPGASPVGGTQQSPSPVRAPMNANSLGAWGPALAQSYTHMAQRMPQPAVTGMPGAAWNGPTAAHRHPSPVTAATSPAMVRHPAMANGFMSNSVSPVHHAPGGSAAATAVAQRRPGILHANSPSTVGTSLQSPDRHPTYRHPSGQVASSPASSTGVMAARSSLSPGVIRSPPGMHVPAAATAGQSSLPAAFSPSSSGSPAVNTFRHASSRPLSSGPVPRAPVAVSSLHSMSRPLSAGPHALSHPAAIPNRAAAPRNSSGSRLSSSSGSSSSPSRSPMSAAGMMPMKASQQPSAQLNRVSVGSPEKNSQPKATISSLGSSGAVTMAPAVPAASNAAAEVAAAPISANYKMMTAAGPVTTEHAAPSMAAAPTAPVAQSADAPERPVVSPVAANATPVAPAACVRTNSAPAHNISYAAQRPSTDNSRIHSSSNPAPVLSSQPPPSHPVLASSMKVASVCGAVSVVPGSAMPVQPTPSTSPPLAVVQRPPSSALPAATAVTTPPPAPVVPASAAQSQDPNDFAFSGTDALEQLAAVSARASPVSTPTASTPQLDSSNGASPLKTLSDTAAAIKTAASTNIFPDTSSPTTANAINISSAMNADSSGNAVKAAAPAFGSMASSTTTPLASATVLPPTSTCVTNGC